MKDDRSVYEKIMNEIVKHDCEVHDAFLNEFGEEIKEFTKHTSAAFLNWKGLESQVVQQQGVMPQNEVERRMQVLLLAFGAITLHIMSMKIFLLGLVVPAGNLMRQVVETIALASLCSSKTTNVLDRYLKGTYSSHKAVRDALKSAKRLGFKEDGVKALENARVWYSKYSHPTMLTYAAQLPFDSAEEGLYVGASFDKGKRESYAKEIAGRVSLAKQLSNFIDGIRLNLSQW
jgi:hypothetical protein